MMAGKSVVNHAYFQNLRANSQVETPEDDERGGNNQGEKARTLGEKLGLN